jgi:hypothetical protein
MFPDRISPQDQFKHRAIAHFITTIWALFNNTLLYGPKLNEMPHDLGWTNKDILQYSDTAQGISLISFMSLMLLLFELGNEKRYAEKLRYALWPEEYHADHGSEKHKPFSYYDRTVKMASASIRTYLNGASIALLMDDLFHQESITVPLAVFCIIISGIGDFSLYLCQRANLPWLPSNNWANKLRIMVTLLYSFGPAALFCTSAIRKMHFDEDTPPDFNFDSWNNGIVTAFCLIGGPALVIATLLQYNKFIANFFGEDETTRQLPPRIQTLKAYRSITYITAIFKAVVSAAATLQVFFDLGDSPAIRGTGYAVSAIGLVASVPVQYGFYKPEPTSAAESLSASLLEQNRHDERDLESHLGRLTSLAANEVDPSRHTLTSPPGFWDNCSSYCSGKNAAFWEYISTKAPHSTVG